MSIAHLRRKTRGWAKAAIANTVALRRYRIEDALVIAGHPRSGTTWLADMCAARAGTSILFEPLCPVSVPPARAVGMDRLRYCRPQAPWPEGERFFRRVLQGRLLNPWTVGINSWSRLLHTRRWVVKLVRGNGILHWLGNTFPIRRPVLLIRHPCAVVASQIRLKPWADPGSPATPANLAAFPQFAPVLQRLRTPEECLAGRWCMANHAALFSPRPHLWRVQSYEKLLLDPATELESIFGDWGLPVPDGAMDRMRIPSRTTYSDSRPGDVQAHLVRWRSILYPGQIRRILAVVDAFGFDFYSNQPEPDYQRLAAWPTWLDRITEAAAAIDHELGTDSTEPAWPALVQRASRETAEPARAEPLPK